MKQFDVIIIGAGASGMACAMALNYSNKKVAIIDHNDKPLKKVAISGGGKCNFSNRGVNHSNYSSTNSSFSISALKKFNTNEFIKIIDKHKIPFTEKEHGQLFCKNSAQDIISMLDKETNKVVKFLKTKVLSLSKQEEFIIETDNGSFKAKNLVIATGGASYPQIGASEFGYQAAKSFGLKIVPYKPALVPLNLNNDIMKEIIKLKGIALKAEVSFKDFRIQESILFTHFGLSGPAILQASLYWNKGERIKINMLPDLDVFEMLKNIKENSKGKKISNILSLYLPNRVVDFIIRNDDIFITEASNKLLKEIGNRINSWEVVPIGTQGFKLAEVTSGGVDVNELSSKTFETNKVKGLFFVGEVLDITGQLGGYNLQWAWASGMAAGNYIKEN